MSGESEVAGTPARPLDVRDEPVSGDDAGGAMTPGERSAAVSSRASAHTDVSETPTTVPRFSTATRAFHWFNAVPFIFLLVSGLLILVPEVKAIHIGGHRLVALLHVLAGVGFIVALPLLLLALRHRRDVVVDVQQALTPEPGDLAWGRYVVLALLGARLPEPPSGKYNLGQKLSSACWIVLTAGLMATGAVLAVNYFTKRVFAVSFVEQAFRWHDVLMLLSLPLLAAHVYLALVNPSTRASLRGMVLGSVDAAWARRHHARWMAQREGRDGSANGPR